MTAARGDLLPPKCPSWWGTGTGAGQQCLLSTQSWALGVQKQLSLLPVLKVTVLAAVTGVWMEQSMSPAMLEQAVPVGLWISEPELSSACDTDVDSDFINLRLRRE